jgi:hypothetical protein
MLQYLIVSEEKEKLRSILGSTSKPTLSADPNTPVPAGRLVQTVGPLFIYGSHHRSQLTEGSNNSPTKHQNVVSCLGNTFGINFDQPTVGEGFCCNSSSTTLYGFFM